MSSSNEFFVKFRDSVVGKDGALENDTGHCSRVRFLMHQYNMVPKHLEGMFENMMRSTPTSPIYAFLTLGIIGTNISRMSSVRRIGAHRLQAERSGTFINFIAPSRAGKGIAFGLLTTIGNFIENKRKLYFKNTHLNSPAVDADGQPLSRSDHVSNCMLKFPSCLFLTGANGLQTQALAAQNGGCGLIFVPEIKHGKARYTDLDGTYGPLLSFYDDYIPGKSYRKAEKIPCIRNCHIHLLAAGVKDDWTSFVQKSGATSGTLGRVLPVLTFDRDMIRLTNECLPPYFFSLEGMQTAFSILEDNFQNISCTDGISCIILEFSNSTLFDEYRATNALLTRDDRNVNTRNLGNVLTTLMNRSPPNSDALLTESSGVGRIKVFLSRTRAEFGGLCKHSGDKLFLDALETNLLRVSCDYFWADFVCSFLDVDGILTNTGRIRLNAATKNLITQKRATIPSRILDPLFSFMRYSLLAAFHLNMHAADGHVNASLLPDAVVLSLKRKRIVDRLSLGYTRAKRRRITFSRLDEALGGITKEQIEEQIYILETHDIVTLPTRRSVELSRRLNVGAHDYLLNSCGYSNNDIVMLTQANSLLID